MFISEMIGLLAEVMANFGDREITLVNEETGEIRYVMGVSVEPHATAVELEHVSFGEK